LRKEIRELSSSKDNLSSQLSEKISLLEEKQKTFSQKIEELTAKNTELEQSRDKLNAKVVGMEPLVEEYKSEISKLKRAVDSEKEKGESLKKSNEDLTERLHATEEALIKYRRAVDTLRRSLEENMKYKVLFLLQDLKKTTAEELSKILAIKATAIMALARTLEEEDWVEIKGEKIELKKSLIEI
ncbi:MAG: hypothetical protein ACFFBD_13430, partial [Candidatus Hodarchaeota archaeon]